MYKGRHLCAVIPARDEAAAIGRVITRLTAGGLVDRIIVCDNASQDTTAQIATRLGAETIYEAKIGYGAACARALSLIEHTDIIVFVDADDSLELDEMPLLLEQIVMGADLAIGTRIPQWRDKASMTRAQIYGNHFVARLIRMIWGKTIIDFGPFRAIRFDRLRQLRLRDRRFGWTVEMQVRAIQCQLKWVEVPVHYQRRTGRSKISGNPRGILLAGFDMISTILRLALNSGRKTLATRLMTAVKR